MNHSRTTINTARDVAASTHADGIVLLHATQGRLFSANQVGASIWAALEQQQPLESIIASISERYGVPRHLVSTDVTCFVSQLEINGLVDRSVGR